MNRAYLTRTSWLPYVVCLLIFSISGYKAHTQAPDNEQANDMVNKAQSNISFIENKGQWPSHVLYRADVPGGQILATPEGMLIGKYDPASLAAIQKYENREEELSKGNRSGKTAEISGKAPVLKGHGWRLHFLGGNLANAQSIERKGESSEYYNYLVGDASTYAFNVHGYDEVTYKDVYPGINVRYYTAAEGYLENDIVVSPGSKTGQIKIQVEGLNSLSTDSKGTIILPTTVGDITIPSPVSYLVDANGNRTSIHIKYVYTGGNTFSFDIPDYDKTKTLIIDPIVMRWATWVSGSTAVNDAHCHGIDLDAAGNIYVTGKYGNNLVTVGAFQTTNLGNHDVFIGKYIEPVTPGGAGQRVWQTYLGTSGDDNPYALNVGPDGNLYIVGTTSGNYNKSYGSGYPTPGWTTQRTCGGSINLQSWVAKVSPNGTWALVREIGPATANYEPTFWDIRTIPTTGGAFGLAVVGDVIQRSTSVDGDIPAAILPGGTLKTGTGDENGFVFRITSDLSTIVWAQQYSSSGTNDDQFNIAVVDNSGNVFTGGYTRGSGGISYNNPSGQTALTGSENGWLMKLNGATGSTLWSRYFNASNGNTSNILCMEFDRTGTNFVIGGLTTGLASYNITTPTAYGGDGDFFVASLPASGAATNWGTYYGGSAQEYNMMGLNVDQNNDIYVLGYTYSKNIATVDYPLQNSSYNTNTGDRQAIFFKLRGTDGDSVEYSTYMGGLSDDYDPLGERGIKFNNCRIYLCVTAESNDFPLTAGTITDLKTSNTSTLDPLIVSMSNPPDMQGNSILTGGNQTITCGQTPVTVTAGVPTYIIPGIIRNTVAQTIGTNGDFPNGVPPITVYQWQISRDTGVTWQNITGATGQNYSPANLDATGLIKFRRIINGDACNRSGDTLAVVNIIVNPTTPAPTISNNGPICTGGNLQLTANTIVGATYYWTGPNGFSSNLQNPQITNVSSVNAGVYQLIVTATSNGCPSYPATTTVVVSPQPPAPSDTSNSPVCTGQTLNLSATGQAGATYNWTGPNGFNSALQHPSIANVTSINAGTYFVTQTVAGCSSPAASVTVTINTAPAPTGITASPDPVCSGQTLTLTATPLTGGTLTWTFPDGGGTSGSPVTRINVTTAMAGTYSVTQTLNGCLSSAATVLVVINPTPAAPVAAATPNPICSGNLLTLTVTGQSGAAFNWTYPDGGGSSGSTVIRNPVTLAMAGTYYVTQTVTGCTSSSSGSVAVVINSLPSVAAASSSGAYCSGSAILLSATGTGGVTPYAYNWSGPASFGSTQQNPSRSGATVAMSGVYNVILTDNHGCTATGSTGFITINTSPSVVASSSSSSYCSTGTISLNAAVTGGLATYAYNWSGPLSFSSNISDPTRSNVTTGMSGVYSVTVTDANTCTASASTSAITVHQSPTVVALSNSASYCTGGSIDLSSTASSGSTPYSFHWSGPSGFSVNQQNPVISSATTGMSGVYDVTVTDNNSCTASASTTAIVVNQSPAITATSSSSAYCASTTIQLNSSPSGGALPYVFSWSGPQSFSSLLQNPTRPSATTAMSGIYTVVVTDGNTCTASASTGNIIVNPGLTVNGNSNSPVCAGGVINLTSGSSGGSSPFTYRWSGPSGYSSLLQNPFLTGASSAMAGIYDVIITDVNGCSGSASVDVVVNPAATVTVSSNTPVCAGGALDLTATPFGGTSPFSYQWSGPANFSANTSNPDRINSQLSYTGNYFVTVSDANGCSGTGSAGVVINATPTVSAASSSPSYCANSIIYLTATPSGGNIPYFYTWSGPASFSSNQQNPDISGATLAMSGNYTVKLSDVNGCSATNSVSVTVNANPVASAGSNLASCSGQSVTLGGNPTATGGLQPYSFTWNNGAASQANPVVNPTSSTTYTVTVTDKNNCSGTASSTVLVHPLPVANAGNNQTIPSCSLVGTTIGATPVASQGTPPYTYSWTPTAGLSSSTAANPTVKGIGQATPYTVVVTDSNGCTASSVVIITVTGSTLSLNITNNGAQKWCASSNGNVTLTANAGGGTRPYSFIWNGADLSSANTASTTASPDVAGRYIYSVVVTDATGCQAGDTTSVLVNSKPGANAGIPDYYLCAGKGVSIGGNPTATGGTLPYSYAWTNGAASVSNPFVQPGATTSYTVVVTDSNGCSASAQTSVNIWVNPVANAGPTENLPGCSQKGLQIGGSPTGSGGNGSTYGYQWSPSIGLSSPSASNPTVSGISSNQIYTVIVTDTNGCTATAEVVVNVISNTPAVNISAGGSTAWCGGSNSSVNLSAGVTAGTTPFSYSWSGLSLSQLNTQTVTASPNSPNTYNYTVIVTDAFKCTASASATITVNTNPVANAGAENYNICSGQSVQIGGAPTAKLGTPSYTYAWSNGASPVANPVVGPLSTTSYVVTVTDANNCSATAGSMVTVRPDPVANAGPDKTIPGCTQTGLQIGGSPTGSGGGGGPYSYSWSPSNGLSSSTAANPFAGGITRDQTYTVVVTDVNGCSASAEMIMLVISNSPRVSITSSGPTSWCAGSNSSVNLTAVVTGGSSPLSYSWSGININPVNSPTATVYPDTAGTNQYTVIVTDAFNCTATASQNIIIHATPLVNAGAAIYNICSGQNVQIGGNPTASGGILPYTYSWNSGANAVANPVVSPVTSSTYVVTVTDSAGCTASASSTVLVRPAVVANAGVSQNIAPCSAACVMLGGSPAGSGGNGILTYAWSPVTGLNSTSAANPTACALAANTTYTLIVTDSTGCSATGEVRINVTPSSLTAEAGTGGQLCFGTGDSVMLGGYPTAVGGVPPYTYNWTPMAGLNITDPANPLAFPTTTTHYILTLTDALGCISIDSTWVRVYPALTANAGNDTTICQGSPVTIGGTPTAGGGSGGGYSYSWAPGTGLNSIIAANPQATPVSSINYVVTVTDGNGCTASNHMTITVRSKPDAMAGDDKTITNCPFDTVLIGANPAGVNGTPPYLYAWSPVTGLNNNTVPNPTVTGISSTQTYTLVVTDVNGCRGTDNVVISVIPSTLQATVAASSRICSGPNSCIQLGGLPTAAGGVSPYVYTWSNVASLTNPVSSNPLACPSTSTIYGLTVTDSKGCTATASESVNVLAGLTINAGDDTAICFGQTVQLGGQPTAGGGSNSGYTYSWSPTIGVNGALSANPLVTPTVTTTYLLNVTDPDGCSASGGVVVVVRTLPIVDAGPDKTISICSNDTVFIGNIPLVTGGGTPPYSYAWSPATGLSDSTVTNPNVSGILHTTSYQIIVTDTFGCKGRDNVIVNVVQQTLQANAGNPHFVCALSGSQINLGGYPAAIGGTPPYVYKWSPAAGLSSSSAPNPVLTVSGTAVYYLSVTDAKGCISVDSVKVTLNPSPKVNAGNDTAICSGFGIILGGNPTARGGTGLIQYSWTPTTGLSANNTPNPSAYPLETTTYTVLVTDSNGCEASNAVTILVHANPVASAGINQNVTTCTGDSVQIGGTPTASGGAGGYIYSWSPANGISSASVPNPFVKGISSSALYTLTVTDANGCSAASVVLVNVVNSSLMAEAGNDVSMCGGSGTHSVTIGGFPTAVGGSAPYIYTWSPGISLNSNQVPNPIATPSLTTRYFVTVSDAKGCIAIDSVIVSVHNSPAAYAGSDTTVCAGSTLKIGSVDTTGDLESYTYSWSPTIGVDDPSAPVSMVTPIATTTYTVTVTNLYGCTASAAITINIKSNSVVNAGPPQTLTACSADSVQLGSTPTASGGNSPYTYTWIPAGGLSNDTSPNPFVKNLGSTVIYTVNVTDSFGCTASAQVKVTVAGSTLVANAGNNTGVCQGFYTPVTLGGTPTASGGAMPYIYSWYPATGLTSITAPNPAANPLTTTTYTLFITDAHGCVASDTVQITIHNLPLVNAGDNDTICAGNCVRLGSDRTVWGGTLPYTITWSPSTYLSAPNVTNPIACPGTTMEYTLTVIDSFGCVGSDNMNIIVNQNPVANAGPDVSVPGCRNACVQIGGSPTASGGSAPYSYSWSLVPPPAGNNTSNPTICDVTTNGMYIVTVTDVNGCSASDSVLVTVTLSSLVADAGPDKSICAGQSSCITIGGTPAVSGGTPPYTINWSPASYICNTGTNANPQVNPSLTTRYVILAIDSKGCIAEDSMLVTANPAVTAIVKPDLSVCSGGAVVIGGQDSTSGGGTPPYTFSWSPAMGLSNPNVSHPVATPQVTSTYCVTVTDHVGCSASTCQTITVKEGISVSAGANQTITGCQHASVTLGGTPTASGGSGSYTFSWTPDLMLSDSAVANPVVTGLSNTTLYTVFVTDNVSRCSGTAEQLVTVIPSTLVANAGGAKFICSNAVVGQQIGAFPAANGGTPPYTYSWSPSTGLINAGIANPVALPSSTQTYHLAVRDANGCIATDSAEVTIATPVVPAITGLRTRYCLNGANVVMSGSPAGGTFTGTGVTGNVFEPHLAGIGTWCITYKYTNDTTGCGADTTICVIVDSLPPVSVTGYQQSYCVNDSPAILSATPTGGVFSGPGMSGNVFDPASAGVGNIAITYTYNDTLSGCSNSLQISITVQGTPTLALAPSMDSACTGEPVIVTPTYSSDVFNIIWSTPGAANFYSGLNAVTVNPSGNNFCLVAKAIATPSGCATVDTLCIAIRPDCKLVAVGVACDADSTYMGDSITVNVLGYDTIPAANDTIVTLSALPLNGTAVVNGNNTITYKPGANFSGFEEFSYEVCVVINNYKICDTAGVCITVVDTNIACFIPNGFSPNGDGVHDLYVVPCNDGFPASELRVFDRWGMEVWRSDGHYLNDWDGRNKQGTVLPDATYYVIYYYNNGTNKAVATYVTIMR